MKFSNAALEEENRWYKEIKAIHSEIEMEIANNLANLSVNDNGVLDRKVSAKAILFSEKKIKAKFEEAAKKLIFGTMEKFGNRGIAEAENAEVSKGGQGSGSWEGPGQPRFVHESSDKKEKYSDRVKSEDLLSWNKAQGNLMKAIGLEANDIMRFAELFAGTADKLGKIPTMDEFLEEWKWN